MAKTGSHDSTLRVTLDVSVSAGGRSEIDGKPGPTSQRFVRITDHNVSRGSWLLNPATHEVHKVHSISDGSLSIGTSSGDRVVTFDMAKDLLLLVRRK